MGIIKIGDYVEAVSDTAQIMGYLLSIKNGNPNSYTLDTNDGFFYVCTAVKHVPKQRQLEKQICEAAGINFGSF